MGKLYLTALSLYKKLPLPLKSIIKVVLFKLGFQYKATIYKEIDRKSKILTHINISTQMGLEIGPLCNPLVNKSESNYNIFYVDFSTAEELRIKYKEDPNVIIDQIVETDFIWGKLTLPELVKGKTFDYVIASHVIEHVPNLLGWLKEIASILKDGGILSLAIPDKRYSFDIKRNLTTMGELVESYLLDRRRPSIKSIFDHVSLARDIDCAKAWSGELDTSLSEPLHKATLRDAFNLAEATHSNEEYYDVHVTIFTPTSFLEVLKNASILNLLDFSLVEFYDTQRGTLEFFVSLQRLSSNMNADEKRELQLGSIERAFKQLAEKGFS